MLTATQVYSRRVHGCIYAGANSFPEESSARLLAPMIREI